MAEKSAETVYLLFYCFEVPGDQMLLTVQGGFFLIAVFILYALIPKRWRAGFLLLGSVTYLALLDVRSLWIAVCAALITYALGLAAGMLRRQGRNGAAWLAAGAGIAAAVGMLLLFKFSFVLAPDSVESLLMPIGFSFYILQSVSYLADVGAGKRRAEKSISAMLLYQIFFPRFASGPIEREHTFATQIRALPSVELWDFSRLSEAGLFMTWGLFCKLVIADRIGPWVNGLFTDTVAYSKSLLVLAVVLYTFQLYADFAGYSMFAVGAARLFGIRLTENFMTPYLSENITEFWQRWHISLSSFLKDYVYIPLGGNRKGAFRKEVNLLLVFLVSGIWHGAGIGFLIWGAMHGAAMVADDLLKKNGVRFLRKGIPGRVFTFLFVSFAWFFFRAASLEKIRDYITVFRSVGWRFHSFYVEYELLTGGVQEWIIIGIGIAALVLADILAYRKGKSFPLWMQERPLAARGVLVALVLALTLVFGIYGDSEAQAGFLYMDF